MEREEIIQSLKDIVEEWKQDNIQSARVNHQPTTEVRWFDNYLVIVR